MSSPAPRTLALLGLAVVVLLWGGCSSSTNNDKRDAQVRTLADTMAQEEMTFLYHHDIQDYIKPQSRDVEVIRTSTLRAGEEARARIEAGMPFAKAVARFSVDPLGRKNGGLVAEVVRRQEDLPLGKAVFSAKLHVLSGPVRLEPGHYYLFSIRKIRLPKYVSLKEYEKSKFNQEESRLEHYRRLYYAQLKSQG